MLRVALDRSRRMFVVYCLFTSVVAFLAISFAASPQGEKLPGSRRRTIFAPYYLSGNGYQTTLGLNNPTGRPMVVHPIIYSLEGQGVAMDPIQIDAHRHVGMDLGQWVAPLGENFKSGSLEIGFESVPNGLGAQITIVNEQDGLVMDIPLRGRGEFRSSRLEGIWWALDKEAEIRIYILNTANSSMNAKVTITRADGSDAKVVSVPLPPHFQRSLRLRDIVAREYGSIGGISIEHDGRPGELMAQGFVTIASRGYSGNLELSDPATFGEAKLHGAGVLVGQVVQGQMNARLSGHLLARNTSGSPIIIAPTLIYGEIRHDLMTRELRPGESAEILVAHDAMNTDGQPIGIEIAHTGPPGSLIGHWFSTDASEQLTVETPLRSASQLLPSSGSNPFSLDGQTSSVLYVKNTDIQPASFVSRIFHSQGEYSIGLRHLGPGQTVAIDIRALRDQQIPDWRGQTLPPDMTSGQVRWYRRTGKHVIGRVNVMNLAAGIANNMSCMFCFCNPRFSTLSLNPNSVSANVGQQVQESVIWTDWSCDNTSESYPLAPSEVSWDSTNWAVASPSSSGEVTCGPFPGSATVFALAWATNKEPVQTDCDAECEESCLEDPVLIDGSASYNVSAPPPPPPPPSISGGDTVWYFNGRNPSGYSTSVTLTASPANAGPYTWTIVSGSNKITMTNFVGNKVDILASGSSLSQTFQDVSIKVRVNNLDSPQFKMTVRGPHRLTSGATVPQPDSTFGYRTFIHYIIKDNLNELMPSSVPANEGWASVVFDDYPGNNWIRGDASGLTVFNSDFDDEISSGRALQLSPNPVPTAPQSPLGTTGVHHWIQEWRVGDLAPGVGRRVQVNTLQRYIDNARHLAIVSPAP